VLESLATTQQDLPPATVVEDLLAAGIHVIMTMNVLHLESLYDTVERAAGVKVRERIPDSILAEADQIVNVDLSTEDLQPRLREGKIYPAERIGTALENFFQTPHLENLKELTLREIAAQIDLRRHETPEETEGATLHQIMVCLSSRGPNSEQLLRYASRLAGKLNRNWYAVYVQTPAEEATAIDSRAQWLLSDTLTLAKELSATVFTYKGEDVAATILRFAYEYRVGHIVLCHPAPVPFWKRILGAKNIPERLMHEAHGMTIVVLDTRMPEPGSGPDVRSAAREEIPVPANAPGPPAGETPFLLSSLLEENGIVLWEEPINRETLLKRLVQAACADEALGERSLQAVWEREAKGSTFFNEGVALLHARVAGLAKPLAVLGLTRSGVTDAAAGKPVECVFLSLTPLEEPEIQVRILALAARAALRAWEESAPVP
jgi:two-component system sensor histidine kinase KdpD